MEVKQEEREFQLNVPVVFFIFKRPDLTQQVFNEIARAKPPKLFVVADGPREPSERKLCEETRSIIKQVDWECEVYTNFSDKNMNDSWRISSGLDWVFSQVDEAIMLEDDCLPSPSFFRFCQILLQHYRDDERVMHISGNNFQFGHNQTKYSYYFSKYSHIWGWATWKRSWQHFQIRIPSWPDFLNAKLFDSVCDDPCEYDYFGEIMERVYSGAVQWDYSWLYTCWMQGGLSILPSDNLVSNIGFRSDAAHTKDPDNPLSQLPLANIWDIQHPISMVRHRDADIFTFDHIFGGRSMKTNLELLRNQLAEAQQQVEELQQKNNSFMQQKDEYEAVIQSLNVDNRQQSARVGDMQEKLAQVQGELSLVLLRNTELEEQQQSIAYEKVRLERTLSHSESSRNQMAEDVKKMENDKIALREKLQNLRKRLQGNQSEKNNIQIELQAQIDMLSNKITAMEMSKFWKLQNAWLKIKKGIGI